MNVVKETWLSNLDRLKNEHKAIASLINGLKVSYIDIPSHFNTGDLLIYLGTERFFREYDVDVQYRALQNDISYNRVQKTDAIIVHGGGNFGDIYISHHRKREQFLLKFAEKKIIFMPQSIYFQDESNIESTKEFFSKLKDVTLFVRDQESYDVGINLTPNTFFMPDMAHSLHPLIEVSELVDVNGQHNNKILNLQRKDCEALMGSDTLQKISFDWGDLCSSPELIYNKFIQESRRLPFFRERVLNSWLHQIDYNTTKAIAYVNSYSIVYTDRLHGFILAYLLGKKVILLDNSYGKIKRYYSKWFDECYLISMKNID